MSFKTTYVLFGALVVVLALFAVSLWWGGGPSEATADRWVLPGMHRPADPMEPQDIDRVEIDRTRPTPEKIVLVRDSETKHWRITEPRNLRADDAHVNSLIKQVYDAAREEEADKAPSLQAWGLEPPAETIVLKKGGREVRLNVGNVNQASDTDPNAVVYVTSSDRKDGMVVKKATLDDALKGLAYFRSKDLLTASTADIQSVALSESDKGSVKKGPLEFKRVSEGRWKYVKPDELAGADAEATGGAPGADKVPTGVSGLLSDVTGLRVDTKDKDGGFVTDDAGDLDKYGLGPKDDVLRVEVRAAEGKEKKPTTQALLIAVGQKVGDKKDQYYARLDGDKSVVKVAAESVEPLRKLAAAPESLRDKNLVDLGGGFRQPDALDIKNSYGLLKFRKIDPFKWRLYMGDKGKGRDVNDTAVTTLINTLTQKDQVKQFPSASRKAQLGLDRPDRAQAIVRIWADGLVQKEKKDEKNKGKDEAEPKLKEPDKPATELWFGNREGALVGVLRKVAGDKEGTLVMVPEGLLDQVKRSPLDYLDKALPQYAPGDINPSEKVTKLELDRGGTKYVVVKGKGADEWKIEAPANLAGRKADPGVVRRILEDLNSLQALRLVAENPPADQLAKDYALKTPALRAVVTATRDGKPKTFTYDFGKDAEGGVYARESQSDLVFVADKTRVADLQRDLRDRTVFHFDVAKVRRLKLTGWKSLLGSPFTLEAEKAGSGWKAVAPKDFKIDEAKLNRFLTDLSGLQAERFVDGGPRADMGLDVAAGALDVEVTVEGQKEPLQLTVGKPDGDKGFFATSKQLPKEAFDVRKDLFEGPISKPAYFSP